MTDPIFRKFFLFCKGLGNVFQKREQRKSENEIGKEGHLGKDISCHLLQFLEIFIFRSQSGMQVQSGFGAFFSCDIWTQESILWSLAAKGWLIIPVRGLSNEESLSRNVFFNRSNLWVARNDAWGISLPRAYHGKIVLLNQCYFQQKQLGLCNIEAYPLSLAVDQKKQESCDCFNGWEFMIPKRHRPEI